MVFVKISLMTLYSHLVNKSEQRPEMGWENGNPVANWENLISQIKKEKGNNSKK